MRRDNDEDDDDEETKEPVSPRNSRRRRLDYLEWDGVTPCEMMDEAIMRREPAEFRRIFTQSQEQGANLLAYATDYLNEARARDDVEMIEWLFDTLPDLKIGTNLLSGHFHSTHRVMRLLLERYKDRFADLDQALAYLVDRIMIFDYRIIPDLERAGATMNASKASSHHVASFIRNKEEGMRSRHGQIARRESRISVYSHADEYVDRFIQFPFGFDKRIPLHVMQTGDIDIIQAMFDAARVLEDYRSNRRSLDIKAAVMDGPIPDSVVEYLCAAGASEHASHHRHILGSYLKRLLPFPEVWDIRSLARSVPTMLEVFRPINLHAVRWVSTSNDVDVFTGGSRHEELEFQCRRDYRHPRVNYPRSYAHGDSNFLCRTVMESIELLLRVHKADQGQPYKIPRDHVSHPPNGTLGFYNLVAIWLDTMIEHANDAHADGFDRDTEINIEALKRSMLAD